MDYGWNSAQTDVERYRVLLLTHQQAVNKGEAVDYTGFETINVELPQDARPIPLGDNTDFKGCTFHVVNNSRDCYLFEYRKSITPLTLDKRIIDGGDFSSVPELATGRKLLIIEDQNVWAKRIGYSYQAPRRDILAIIDGQAQNSVVYTYDTPYSNPRFFYGEVSDNEKYFGNIAFIRSESSTHKTFLVHILNEENFRLSNIRVETPDSRLTGDYLMNLENLYRLSAEEISVDGTYSATDSYGYAIAMDNVAECRFADLQGNTRWGFFGNYNINGCTLANCHINRFDIHCYGKDVVCRGCEFSGYYNQLSSFYGTLTYDSCTFTDFVPVLIEPSFNAFTPFSLVMTDCVWKITPNHNFLIDCSTVTTEENVRQELRNQSLPTISISNLTVHSDDVDEIGVFGEQSFSKGHPQSLYSKSGVDIDAIRRNISSARRLKIRKVLK